MAQGTPRIVSAQPLTAPAPRIIAREPVSVAPRIVARDTPSAPRRFLSGVGEGLGDLASMVAHPIDTVTGFAGGIADAVRAVPDVVRGMSNVDTQGATMRGFRQGAIEGLTGLDADEAKRDPATAAGRFTGGVLIPALTLKAAPKGLRTIRGVRATRATQAAEVAAEAEAFGKTATRSGVPARVPLDKTIGPTFQIKQSARAAEAAAAAEAFGKTATGSGVPPRVPLNTFDPTFQIDVPVARNIRAIEPTASGRVRPIDAPPSVDAPAAPATTPKGEGFPVAGGTVRPKPDAVAGMRRAVGAKAAARFFGIPEADVRRLAPGPSRRPMVAEAADDHLNYLRRINDPRGFAQIGPLVKIGAPVAGAAAGGALADDNPLLGAAVGALGGAALANPGAAVKTLQQARMVGMLSGAALPKSIAGNLGAVGTAAVERGSLAPLRELLRVQENLKNAKRGFTTGANPAHTAGIGKINLPGRLMGALDETTQKLLERAGLTKAEAQRLLLTTPEPLHGRLGDAMKTPVGQFLVPFQRVPFNSFAEGVNSLADLAPSRKAPVRNRALTAGTIGAGAIAGSETDHPLLLALAAALAGPRALPFALGAGATAGPEVIKRVGIGLPDGSMRDFYDPLRPIDKPAIVRLLRTGGR